MQSISWTQDGDVSAVTFFSPTEVLRARQVAAMEAATAAQTAAPQRSDAFGMNPGIWDETPEMEELRKKAEKATGDEAMHYARQWHKLHQEMITYRSS